VSPESARPDLMNFIQKAKRQLLIYDPKVSDRAIGEALHARAKAGVDVKIIGRVGGPATSVPNEKFPGHRLHVRLIIRDGRDAFLGSQSLRTLELDKRREIGIILKEKRIVSEMLKVFEDDWAETPSGKKEEKRKAKEMRGDKKKRDSRRPAA
jgi:cardiolipin synthase A/B